MIVSIDAEALLEIGTWSDIPWKYENYNSDSMQRVRTNDYPPNITCNISLDIDMVDEKILYAASIHDGPIEFIINNLYGHKLHFTNMHMDRLRFTDGKIQFYLGDWTHEHWEEFSVNDLDFLYQLLEE